ncbi:trypsin-like serine protease [Streptomyces sp. KLOTTS4A1]|uniref:trypsin-like serine protease n=1 Tax=Streptomyces sp. KLOTTS4A1 TaxID=3390996 RepID=UPI0039F62B53
MPTTRHSRLAALGAALAAGTLTLTAAPALAITGGTPVAGADTTHAYTAQITIGAHDRGCSAVLVDREWLLTAASCFAEDPTASLAVPAGVPRKTTTAVIGRSDLGGTQGAERRIVELVPRTDRDVVLARLNRPVTNVAPAALATAAPAAGAELTFAGYGRTKTVWAPLKLHTGTYTVDAAADTSVNVTGKDAMAACAGDTGGPVLSGGKLVGLSSRSAQGGCLGIDESQTSTAGIIARVDDLGPWIDAKAGATRITDFNGDGAEDIAIGDPMATVGGDTTAGLVRVIYGGGKGTAQIDQDLDWVPGGAEGGDHFGNHLATVDYNEDGYTDLVVSASEENVGSVVDAGFVDILYGGPEGLGTGAKKATHFEQGSGSGDIGGSGPEKGDRMGASLAAGTTAEGEPWILIGAPGEALGSLTKSGVAFYVRGGTDVVIHQDSPGVPGAAEAGDAFGSSVAGDENFIAIGAPGDDIGGDANAGNMAVLSHKLDANGRPTVVMGLDQDNAKISGTAEAGDKFAAALALVAYRPSGAATATDSILAIGAPGEALSVDGGAQRANAGNVMLVHIKADGTWDYQHALNQGNSTDDRSGTIETGDAFGSALSAVNTAPRAVGSAATLKIAVGVPGEDLGSAADAGAIQTFSLMGSVGGNDHWVEAGDGDGIPGSPGEGDKLGRSIHFTARNLYAGMPYGPAATGSLHVLPFPNVVPGGTSRAATTYQPGQGGLPASGSYFGYSVR